MLTTIFMGYGRMVMVGNRQNPFSIFAIKPVPGFTGYLKK
jgi:hypothetical protein